MSEHGQWGVRALKLLAERSMIAILWCLADGSMRPVVLERVLPEAGHSVVRRRLRKLQGSALVSSEIRPGLASRIRGAPVPDEAHYELTDAGRTLLEVAAEAAHWERRWAPASMRSRPAGSGVVELIGDGNIRRLITALADGAMEVRDLEQRLPDVGHAALRRRLRQLALADLLQEHQFGQSRRYGLTPSARRLASVALLAGRWEYRWMAPEPSVPGDDLADLLRLLAPAARLPTPIAGICQLHLEEIESDGVDVYLAVHGGSVRALSSRPSAAPQAVGRGTPDVWCDTLFACEGPIRASGDEQLLAAILRALNAALRS